MAVSKVTLNGTTLIDATGATATAADIISPKTAMLANGVVTTGTGSGGASEDGFVDAVLTDADYATGSMQDNALVNYTTAAANKQYSFVLKRPISITSGDVITMQFINGNKAGGWSSVFLVTAPYGEVALNDNFSVNANSPITITRTESTYDTYEILAIKIGPRHTVVWNNYCADLHLYLNDVLIF